MRVDNDFHSPDALSHSCEWASANANLWEMAMKINWLSYLHKKGSHLIIAHGEYLPPTSVLTVLTELGGPSPISEKVNTWNSYFVNIPSPVTSWLRTELLSIVMTVSGSSTELEFLYRSLNPVIIWKSAVGNCQDAWTLVEEEGVTVKLVGARLGARRNAS